MRIVHPSEDNLEYILEFAFRHLSPPELNERVLSILGQYENGLVPLEGIFAAEDDNGIAGVLFSQPRQDCGVMLWVPSVSENCPADIILAPFIEYCEKHKFQAALAFADYRQQFNEPEFIQDGKFEYLSDLVYFSADINPVLPAYYSDACGFQPAAGKADGQKRLEEIIRETYSGTLDFPRLMGTFPVDKVLDEYRQGGLFQEQLWFFVQDIRGRDGSTEGDISKKDIGVLLLTDRMEHLEITYTGLIKEIRGQGLAKEIIRFAKSTAKERGCKLLTAAADERNKPAVRTYINSGFQAWDRKKIFVRYFLTSESPSSFANAGSIASAQSW
jgi:GNAT superfamily N-acetyltransferase